MKTTLLLTAVLVLACETTFVDALEQKAKVQITILYDNTCAVGGVESDWGFSCFVEGMEKTKAILDEDIYMVVGGFHLRHQSDEVVGEIIERFRKLGVKKCGPTHCTGDQQIERFKKAYGEDFVSMGVGKVLCFEKAL